MSSIKHQAKKLIPKSLLDNYHYPQAVKAARTTNYPSSKMIVIGVVGSKGKTTTANMLWAVLSAAGHTVGQIGTANIRIGKREELNKWHMTMPGAPRLQKILAEMRDAHCTHVVMEVPSEGQTQWRHIGINFDMLIFTGVEREIMAAHRNSMTVLHKHNKRVFVAFAKSQHKTINGVTIPKTIVANTDSKFAPEYMNFTADNKVTFSAKTRSDYQAKAITLNTKGTQFEINKTKVHINLIGVVNAINAAGTIAAATTLGVNQKDIQKGFDQLKTIPGRMEPIDLGQKFAVYVDYAHSPVDMTALMQTGKTLLATGKKLIVLFGGQGGGRDIEKRQELGKITGKYADVVVLSNDDPYDDDPMQIIEDIAAGAEVAGKQRDKDLILIPDRREGISKALEIAKAGDVVFIACKGADQLMMLANGKSIAWDDRTVTREELKKIIDK